MVCSEADHPKPTDLLTLNVRGTKFLVERANLLKRHEGSLLHMLARKLGTPTRKKSTTSTTPAKSQQNGNTASTIDNGYHRCVSNQCRMDNLRVYGSNTSNALCGIDSQLQDKPSCQNELYFDRNPCLVNSILDSYETGEYDILV